MRRIPLRDALTALQVLGDLGAVVVAYFGAAIAWEWGQPFLPGSLREVVPREN